jgi:hypothetical protein
MTPANSTALDNLCAEAVRELCKSLSAALIDGRTPPSRVLGEATQVRQVECRALE